MSSQFVFIYDGSFAGFLTALFESTRLKVIPLGIEAKDRHTPELFAEILEITTEDAKAERVWRGLELRASHAHACMVRGAFLSEIPGIEMQIWHFQHKLFTDRNGGYCRNVFDEHVQMVMNTARKVQQEIHRYEGFLRFQPNSDGLSYACIEPTYNIIESLAPHFSSRFPGMHWIILDTQRNYAAHYDGTQIQFTQMQIAPSPIVTQTQTNSDEFIDLWKQYYHSINIPERKNTTQMLRFMPRKYWKYLPERAESIHSVPR